MLLGVAVGVGVSAVVLGWNHPTVSAERPLNMYFSVPGRLTFVVPIGTTVAAGDVVARLDDSALSAAVRQAEVNVAVAEAKAAELQAVAAEQNLLSRTAMREATNDQNALFKKDRQTLRTVLATMATTTQNAVAHTNALFINATSSNPVLLVPADALSAAAAESGRTSVTANVDNLVALENSVSASSTSADLIATAQNATADIAEIQLFLESLHFLEQQASTSAATSTAQLDLWQQKIATARTGIDTLIYSILSAQDALTYDTQMPQASSSAVVLDNHLASHEAAAARALASAKSVASSTLAALAKLTLHAPAAGSIAAPAAPARLPSIGQLVTAGQPIISLLPKP